MPGAEPATKARQPESKSRARSAAPEVAAPGALALPFVPFAPIASLPSERMRHDALLNLQRWGGNAMVQRLLEHEAQRQEEPVEEEAEPEPVPETSGQGDPQGEVVHKAGTLSLEAETKANFDKPPDYSTSNTATAKGSKCAGCPPANCVHVSGTLTTVYTVTTKIFMPEIPDNLSECEKKKVQAALDGTLYPHELEHVAAFEQYNGTTERQYAFDTCRDAIPEKLKAMVNKEAGERKKQAEADSAKLDPFVVDVDLDDCEEKKEEEAPAP
jgi:hypothetical protein